MHIKKFIETVCLMLVLSLTACSTIYVADVPFSSVEICSEELASRLHPDTGCIPAARASDAKAAFVGRYRHFIDEDEWSQIATVLTVTSGISENKNLLPDWIGRAIPQQKLETIGWKLFPTPSKNSFDVLGGIASLNVVTSIPTVVSFPTDLSGILHKKIAVSADLNAAEIASSALKLAGLPSTPPLKNALTEKVLAIGYMSDSLFAGKGNYSYVSMRAKELDLLTTAITICKENKDAFKKCSEKLTGKTDPMIIKLIEDAENVGADTKVPEVGIVFGVAVLHTHGASERCNALDIQLISKGASNNISQDCKLLHDALDDRELTSAVKAAAANYYVANGASSAVAASSVPSTSEITNSLLISVQAAFSKHSVKKLGVSPRTTVLALHWLPLAISGVPAP